MFGFFHPTCPVDPCAKAWIEDRLDWLSGEFGREVFTRRAVVLPLQEFFPDDYDASDESVRALLDRVCLYMDADPSRVELNLFDNAQQVYLVNERGEYLPNEAGLYDEDEEDGRIVIHLSTTELHTPLALVGTMAHELAHLRLLGERRIDGDVFDNELLTDLTVVFHGMGIFMANSPRAWRSEFSTWPETDVRRPEYMTQPMFGYALAHAAWLRGERKPAWAAHLRMDARCSFKQGLRYLWETDDSNFRP